MKIRVFSFLLCVLLTVGLLPLSAAAVQNTEDIVILYENDVHCAVEGYSKLSALKAALSQTYAHVGTVSCGDFIQGGSLGVISRGEYIIELMNLVGYDAVAPGNHEFDYRLEQLDKLLDMLDAAAVCCNFQRIGEVLPYFEPYSIVSYGQTDVAFIGITTPYTLTKSSPGQFKDADGEYLFTFNPDTICTAVQRAIDSAEAAGADYVIALSHIGYGEDSNSAEKDVRYLISNTEGFDAVLDGHSHSVIEAMTLTDKGGNPVLLSSTGTKFEHIGMLTLSNGEIKTELIKTDDLLATDPEIDAHLEKINSEYALLGDVKIAFSEVDLITQDENGNRLVRNTETNLGDLCAEAFRSAVDADIGYINGGGLRADIPKGDVTFNHLLSVLPFNNTVVLASVDGQTIKDMLEMAMRDWPEEGSFPHLSGITFSFNKSIPSSVILDEFEEFSEVSGQYRVYDIKVFNRETQKYEPLELDGTYTLASHNYYLIENGSGMKMLRNAEILENDGILDVEALELYVVETLGGVIGEQYRETQPSITFTDGEISPSGGTYDRVLIVTIAVGSILILLLAVIIVRKAAAARRK